MGKSRQTGKLSSDGILFSDIGNSRVGVGSTQPTASLDVNGSVSATSFSGSGSSLTGLTGASAATYGDENSTPVIVVDANGRITGISTVATAGAGSGGGISDILEDTTPQLGGTLDLNSNDITGTGNINITGILLQHPLSSLVALQHNSLRQMVPLIVLHI